MRLNVTTLCVLVALCGCSKQRQTEHEKEVLEWQRLHGVQFYWESERTNWLAGFSSALRHMGEPVYWNVPTNQLPHHLYRFLWLRTFHKPVVVNITPTPDGRWQVRSKTFSGRGGYDLGELEREDVATNASPEIVNLVSDLDTELHCVPEYDGAIGCDGATWFIDGVKDGRYSMAHTWSPESGWIRQMGMRFLSAAKIHEKEIY